jgi:tetratricopeptide (TPR) repeat protein
VTGQSNGKIAGGTSNPDAYDAYLRGLELYLRGTPEDIVKAVAAFRQALVIDPDFGAASADLAWLFWDLDDQRAKALGLSWEKYDEIEAKTYEYLEAAAKHPSPSYYQLIAFLLIRQRKSDEAIDALQKGLALNPSHPWTLEALSHALSFNGRPGDGRAYIDAALRVDPGWNESRYHLAGLAAFGESRFEDATALLEKIDVRSPNPWPKFYGLQLLLSAYGHLGNNVKIAATKKNLEMILTERSEGEPNLLKTQQYFVFKHEADIERLLEGLHKAGVPDLHKDVELSPKDRLTGSEIKALILGRNLRGRKIAPEVENYGRTVSADGSVRETVGSWSGSGTSWVQADFMCDAFPRIFANCGAVFRNPFGNQEQNNAYLAVFRGSRYEFAVVK